MHKEVREIMAQAKAVLFDFDGVILDSEWPIYQSWKRLFEREGFELKQDDYVQCIGSDFDTWSPPNYLEELSGRTFDWDRENSQRQEQIIRDLEHAEPMPGVARLAQELSEKPTAVVSSSSHRWVDGWLEKLELMPYFDTTVCRGDAPKIKPAPDLFLEAARQLGIDPRDCLVIEDSMNGLLSAHQAGMKVVAVPNRLTRVLDFSRANWTAESLEVYG
ncbi:MAG: HAD-IA family hydrolase [Verrucomicrobiae bacterium]|nr:HAD-IA family hydrolase [Verrucomicrobiae bacterium]NNJ44343.1 HAD-IA family hydrolase [Akkermansiaceae bacterium]